MACGPEDCRYGLFDFEYQHQCEGTTEKTKKEKLLLMSWCPDTAKIKKKMLYSSSFDALKKCLVGVQKYIQVICRPKIKYHIYYLKAFLISKFSGVYNKTTYLGEWYSARNILSLRDLTRKYIILFPPKATDESEASAEAVEEKLRSNNRM